ncbi:hypothetical protein KAT63_00560 [Candidatus Parcubacteria bacterium]|nr:hypothetical protein [Candidatus Parcubacteria bacterium]
MRKIIKQKKKYTEEEVLAILIDLRDQFRGFIKKLDSISKTLDRMCKKYE